MIDSVLKNGEVQSPIDLPRGCFFANRCIYRDDTCCAIHPSLVDTGEGHLVRCPKVFEH